MLSEVGYFSKIEKKVLISLIAEMTYNTANPFSEFGCRSISVRISVLFLSQIFNNILYSYFDMTELYY